MCVRTRKFSVAVLAITQSRPGAHHYEVRVCVRLKQGNFNSRSLDTQGSFAEKHSKTLPLLSSHSREIQNRTIVNKFDFDLSNH